MRRISSPILQPFPIYVIEGHYLDRIIALLIFDSIKAKQYTMSRAWTTHSPAAMRQ